MNVGIIAEYNPFHAGHAYQISQVRKKFSDAKIISVMSGSFTQRGTPSSLDKWTIVDAISFGAETSNLQQLQLAADAFNSKNFPAQIKSEMSAGISYAAAVAKILSTVTHLDEKFFRQPNTILAIEYLRALPERIQPILIERIGAGYGDLALSEKFSSAAAIRHEARKEISDWEKISASVQEKTLHALQAEKAAGFVDEEFLLRPLLTKIFTSSVENLRGIYGMNEGLEFRIIDAAKSAKTFSELVNAVASKRYPISRVKRLFLHVILNLTPEKISELQGAHFARVLAFNARGQNLLKKIRASSTLPIVTKVSQHLSEWELHSEKILPYKKNLALDLVSTDLRGILFAKPRAPRQDFLQRISSIEQC